MGKAGVDECKSYRYLHQLHFHMGRCKVSAVFIFFFFIIIIIFLLLFFFKLKKFQVYMCLLKPQFQVLLYSSDLMKEAWSGDSCEGSR